jgi:anti-sigma factor RsiW
MMAAHLTQLDIADYLDDAADHLRRAEIRLHLSECDRCTSRLRAAETIDAAVDAEVINEFVVRVARREGKSQPADIEAEMLEATAYLSGIVLRPRAFRSAALRSRTSLHTVGVVRLLCEAASFLRRYNSTHAYHIAVDAAAIARTLSPLRYDRTTLNATAAQAESIRIKTRAAARFRRAAVLRSVLASKKP